MSSRFEIHIKIWGRVQGVFFRATAQEVAQRLKLNGFVKNASDGTVEICLIGSLNEAQDLLTKIQVVNPRIRIDKKEVASLPVTRTFSSFEIT
ncbi:MAG: acylphosphatase [Simkaniaceae bacterium]